MSSSLIFLPEAWDDYLYWQGQEKKTLRRINSILKDISRNAFEGKGRPEPLKEDKSGWWSRRIDEANRIVYRVKENSDIEIAQCRGHYGDQ